jgi:hypothetical protein
MKQTSKDRPRQYRENQNSERMDKVKEKKKLQNKAYKEKLEKRRQSNEELDKVCNFRKKNYGNKRAGKGKGPLRRIQQHQSQRNLGKKLGEQNAEVED